MENPKLEYKAKPRKCPNCKSKRIANILYGYPAFSEELSKKLDEGKITLGGCVVNPDNPRWECADCGTLFFRKLDLDIDGFPDDYR